MSAHYIRGGPGSERRGSSFSSWRRDRRRLSLILSGQGIQQQSIRSLALRSTANEENEANRKCHSAAGDRTSSPIRKLQTACLATGGARFHHSEAHSHGQPNTRAQSKTYSAPPNQKPLPSAPSRARLGDQVDAALFR